MKYYKAETPLIGS